MGLPPDIEASHPALGEFQRDEEKAQQALERRIGEVEARLVEESSDPARGLALQLADLDRRLTESKAESEARSTAFRAKLAAGPVSQDEFRAQLVMLDMEYASRLRLAEDGLRLLSCRLEQTLGEGRDRIRALVGELRDALRFEVNPTRNAVARALADRESRLREKSQALEEARAEAEEARRRVAALEKDRESSDAYQKAVFDARIQDSSQSAAEAARRLKDRETELAALEAELAAQRSLQSRQAQRRDEEALALRQRADELEARLEEAERGAGRLEAENRGLKERLSAPPVPPPPPAPDPEAAAAAERNAAVLEDAKKAIQSLREEHEAFADKLGRLQAERDEAVRRLEEAREDAAARAGGGEPPEALKEARAGLEAMRKELDEALLQLQQSRAGHESTRAERDALQLTLQSAATKIPEAAERMRGLMEDFRQDSARKDQEIVRLKDELAKALDMTRPPAYAPGQVSEETQRRMKAMDSELRIAKDEADQLKAELEAGREKSRELYKRILQADKARDATLGEERDRWLAEKAELEDNLAARTREVGLLKGELEANERSWQETMARQDATRMQELFKLRAEVQKLKWRLIDKGAAAAKQGAEPAGPGGPIGSSSPSPGTAGSGTAPAAPTIELWTVGETPPVQPIGNVQAGGPIPDRAPAPEKDEDKDQAGPPQTPPSE